ncbi:hypothetical protein C2S52_008363 [Perilla frutescens var. hirtella]|nr:hypothetical protein C2S52_008363 [Perilla frutescens var. hirtella]
MSTHPSSTEPVDSGSPPPMPMMENVSRFTMATATVPQSHSISPSPITKSTESLPTQHLRSKREGGVGIGFFPYLFIEKRWGREKNKN